jgi:hypothetical protein
MALFRQQLLQQYQKLHNSKRYGYTSESLLYFIMPLVLEAAPRSILDYGCGQSQLLELLAEELFLAGRGDTLLYRYDPAIEDYAAPFTGQADLVICTDVLEHIPEEDLPQVVQAIVGAGRRAIFVISNRKAIEHLPDGGNAHCTIYPPEWWREVIAEACGGFVKTVPWPIHASCCLVTWDSQAIGGMVDLVVKYLGGRLERLARRVV